MSLLPSGQKAAQFVSSASRVPLTKPFTPKTLKNLRDILSTPEAFDHNEPSVLFELRSKALRNHSGEVSFPGGRVDDTDPSIIQAALRETDEELGIPPSTVQVLGQIGPPEMDMRGKLRVWPIIGFLHANDFDPNLDEDTALPSLDMNAVRSQASKDEVGTVFHLPLSMLVAPARLKPAMFRGARPYWSVDVTDIVSRYCDPNLDPNPGSVDEVGSGVGGKVEVWGLTGWYLSLMLRRLKIYQ